MKFNDLEEAFKEAKERNCSICVEITIPGQKGTELIINSNSSLDNKLDYYRKTYNDDLVHNHCSDIKIVSALAIDFAIQMD